MIEFYNLSQGQEDAFVIKIKRNSDEVVLLVDGGRQGNYVEKIKNLGLSELNYIILTHIDNDHIRGLIKLLEKDFCCDNSTIIYNKFVNGLISYKQAIPFEKLIENKSIIVSYLEYQETQSDEVVFLSVDQRKKLVKNENKIYFTFLGPSKKEVENLYSAHNYSKSKNYKKVISGNSEIVNKSSIMFMLEYKENTILMLGDGFIGDINSKIQILIDKDQTYCPVENISLVKIPHHGSQDNNKGIDTHISGLCNNYVLTASPTDSVEIGEVLKKNLKRKNIYATNEEDDINKLKSENKLNITKKDKIIIEKGEVIEYEHKAKHS